MCVNQGKDIRENILAYSLFIKANCIGSLMSTH